MTPPEAGCRTASRPASSRTPACVAGPPTRPTPCTVSGMLASNMRGDHVDERHLCHDGPPALRALAEHGALQQPTGTEAAGRQPGAVDEPVQAVRHGEVVGEGVLLVLEVALDPPPPPALAPAADVGVGEDHPGVEQARQGGVPGGVVAGLVGAVPVEQRGGGAVERDVAVGVRASPAPGSRRGRGRSASRRRRPPGRDPGRPGGAVRSVHRCAGRRPTRPVGGCTTCRRR